MARDDTARESDAETALLGRRSLLELARTTAATDAGTGADSEPAVPADATRRFSLSIQATGAEVQYGS